MLSIQIILIIFFLFALVKVGKRYYYKDLSLAEALSWSIFWVGAGIIVTIPNSTFYFARLLGVGRGADVVIYAALVLLFFILFRLTIKIDQMSKHITLLTRRHALNRKNEEDKNKST